MYLKQRKNKYWWGYFPNGTGLGYAYRAGWCGVHDSTVSVFAQ